MEASSLSDEELVQRFKAGEKAAFEELFRRYENQVFRLARVRVRSDDAALELVQEVFLRVYRALPSVRSGSLFRSWLCRICLNVAASAARSEARRIRAESIARVPTAEVLGPAEAMVQRETFQRLRTALERLPRLLADTLILREVEGLSYGEIGEAMRCSEKAVEMRLLRARRKLRRSMAELEGRDEMR